MLSTTLQCVAGAMYITGFSESVAELLGLQTQWAVRCMSAAVLLGLLGINLAGVKWIVRLQLLLLAVLAISTLDFVIGTFTHLDPGNDHHYDHNENEKQKKNQQSVTVSKTRDSHSYSYIFSSIRKICGEIRRLGWLLVRSSCSRVFNLTLNFCKNPTWLLSIVCC